MSIPFYCVSIKLMSTLREIREKRAISLKQLFKMTGISIATISQIENKKRKARHITRQKIAAALNLKPEDIDF